jgi:hypothetical protein
MKKATILQMYKGHRCFEFDLKTKIIKEAEIDEVIIKDEKGNDVSIKKVKRKPNCLYETALNKRNADRLFIKRIHQLRKEKLN